MSNMSDGEKISSYMREFSSKFKSEGRKAIYVIIATAWSISYADGKFIPSNYVISALVLAVLFIFFDLLYYLISSSLYKYLLNKYFITTKDGDFLYKDTVKDETQITKTTKLWMHVGQIWTFVLSCLLLTSFIFIILAILSLKAK